MRSGRPTALWPRCRLYLPSAVILSVSDLRPVISSNSETSSFGFKMDHFPLFSHLLKPLVSIRLLDEIPYDNKGFQGFQERAGFDEKEILEGLFVGDSSLLKQKPSLYTSFIQSWFYWGLLHECLQQPVQTEDFFEAGPDGHQTLTTRNLERELIGWAQRLQNMEANAADTGIRNARDTLARVQFLLTLLSGRIEKASGTAGDSNKQFWLRHGREILPHDLEFSICALGYALRYAIEVFSVELGLVKSAYHGRRAASWHTPPGLIHALRSIGWCKSDMQHFEADFGFVIACMAIILPGLNRKGDHSNCTSDRCEADNISLDEYKRSHVNQDCVCSDLVPQQAWDEMLRIVEGDGIPLVRLRPKSADLDGEVEFEILSASPDLKYVAFSHVWADGRGNMRGNGLFECQWRWLQACAQECQEKDSDLCSVPLKEMVPFWIDTFCVPRGSDQRVAGLRTRAILMMSEIYRGADDVLVLDSALENAGDMSILEFGMRLKFCGWSRRVWTLHEGAVAHNLMFRMAKGLVDLRSTNYQMAKARYPYRDKDGWHILRGIEEEYIHAVLQSCLMINKFAPSVKSTFFLTWSESQKRATSIDNDRYLVLGIINQVSKETLLELQRSEVDQSDPEAGRRAKLKSILLSTSVIPQSIVFSIDERFQEPGMQWAPSAIGAEIPSDDNDGPLQKIPGKGVVVKYKGWRITSSLHAAVISTFMFTKLDRAATYCDRYRLGLWPTDKERKNFATLIPAIGRNTPLAIILSGIPDPEDTSVNFRRALLVEELGNIAAESSESPERHDIIHAKYLALLRIYSVPEGVNLTGEFDSSWINQGLDQLWCVG
jgi:hypothetical protein